MYHKILNLAFATVGFAALASCSSDDNLSKKGSEVDGSHYLAIDIRSVSPSPSLRAVDGYENGTSEEGRLAQVRFYFFDAQGNAFSLNNANQTNFIDVYEKDLSSTKIQGGSPTTVERQTRAVLVVDGINGGTPSQIIAIANPQSFKNGNNSTGAGSQSLFSENRLISSIAALKATSLVAYANNNGAGGEFAMSNSVYKDGSEEMCAVSTVGYVKTSQEEAEQTPVDIYIERLAAKVTANKSSDPKWVTIEGKDAYRVDTLTYSEEGVTKTAYVYAVIQGWGLADEQMTGTVEKNITGNSTWDNNGLGFPVWNTADYHRSFWETTPTYIRVGHDWNSYTHPFSATDAQYTMPNTGTAIYSLDEANRSTSPNELTKVLVAARLYYTTDDGDEAETPRVAEISHDITTGANYIGKANLLNAILARSTGVPNGILKLTKNEEGTVTAVATLTSSDLDFELTGAANKDYEVRTYLKQDANVTYAQQVGRATTGEGGALTYEYNEFGGTTDKGFTEANNIIKTNKANIFTSGDTYYYTSIQHLAATATPDVVPADWYTAKKPLGWFGVVRNHWYNFTINSLNGLGTAVFDPTKTIVPVIPMDNNSYLAARLNILQWRVVPQTVDINGNSKQKPSEDPGPTGE